MNVSFNFDATTAWVEGSDWDFHERQYATPYKSTIAFADFLAAKDVLTDRCAKVLDVGAGMGGISWYLSQRFGKTTFHGIDLNGECVDRGNSRFAQLGATRCHLAQGDLYKIDATNINAFDGIISLATLSWLPDFESAAECLIDLNPEWVAATSLFYNGPVDATIVTKDYSRPIGGVPFTEKFYNIYSLPRVEQFFASHGYTTFSSQPFEIDIDLPRPEHGGMGTFTESLSDGRRLQISGPVLMSWYFILARKEQAILRVAM